MFTVTDILILTCVSLVSLALMIAVGRIEVLERENEHLRSDLRRVTNAR